MNQTSTLRTPRIATMAEELVGSEIIKLAGEIKARMNQGEEIFNFTIGDFDPAIFPIPVEFSEEILRAYQNNETNYPPSNGMPELRAELASFMQEELGLTYHADDFLVAGGARPIIYAAFQALVNPGEKVIFPVPSWNNNHYTHLSRGTQVFVETTAHNNFMPSADELKEHVSDAALIALCSPLNPTGTVFSQEQLLSICNLVLEENARRGPEAKPLYLMYDQIYWQLCQPGTQHVDPVSLCPEMRQYTVYVDGISKALAATGVRVGWGFGPAHIINKMKAILGHVGAWAPRAEQVACAKYLQNRSAVRSYLIDIRQKAGERMTAIFEGCEKLRAKGYAVQAIAPKAAIYLTIQFDLVGKTTAQGEYLDSVEKVTAYLLNNAGLAIVPFYAFGSSRESNWFRLSIGTASMGDIPRMLDRLESALSELR
ncbi:MAG: aminotransferase class I/II-fold pyridoxal phosphate-dependent enzyme [Flavobacteriales bacterium]|nr:aminotransferase class I/II-fold pyridoxal phosphate-dependent enzyme [Flavobacteriales bacterium]